MMMMMLVLLMMMMMMLILMLLMLIVLLMLLLWELRRGGCHAEPHPQPCAPAHTHHALLMMLLMLHTAPHSRSRCRFLAPACRAPPWLAGKGSSSAAHRTCKQRGKQHTRRAHSEQLHRTAARCGRAARSSET